MHNNPYSNEPTDIIPPMPDLPPKQTPHPPAENVERVEVEERVVDTQQEEARTVKFIIGKIADFLRWLAIVIEVLMLIEFIFRLIGADPTNPFASFLYALTEGVILVPFSNLVHDPVIHYPNQVFEWTTLIAMAIYALIFWLIRSFVRLLASEPQEPVE